MWKRKKFHIVLEVYKLVDSDNERVSDINGNEYRKDGLKSKSIENVRVPKVECKHHHVLMVGGSSLISRGTSPAAVKAPGDMNAFSIISDIINEKLLECGVWGFSFKGNKQDIVDHDGEKILSDRRSHRRTHTSSCSRNAR